MSFPGGSPSQAACFPPSLPPQSFSFSLGAAISWPFITPAPPSFSWSLTLQERPFWSAGFHRCWIRSWEVPRLYGRLLRKLLFHRPPEGPEAHSRLLLPDQPDRLPGRDHGRVYRRKSLYSLPGSGRRPGMGRSLPVFKRKESIHRRMRMIRKALDHPLHGIAYGPA